MTIELTSEHQRMIERVIDSGAYPDAQHVGIQASFRLPPPGAESKWGVSFF